MSPDHSRDLHTMNDAQRHIIIGSQLHTHYDSTDWNHSDQTTKFNMQTSHVTVTLHVYLFLPSNEKLTVT